MLLHQEPICRVQPPAGVPRKQLLRFVRLIAGMIDIGHRLSPYSQSAKLPASASFRRRRAWNMRVFTVSTGQSTISAISR